MVKLGFGNRKALWVQEEILGTSIFYCTQQFFKSILKNFYNQDFRGKAGKKNQNYICISSFRRFFENELKIRQISRGAIILQNMVRHTRPDLELRKIALILTFLGRKWKYFVMENIEYQVVSPQVASFWWAAIM